MSHTLPVDSKGAGKHKHEMKKLVKNKVPLYDIKSINGERNELLVGHDIFTSKVCECGFKQPFKVERQVR